ncbi:hypothetical protein PSE_4885 [Pseudovibrio sp. FO-BEG1]|nr:hypothetical protein PSE_4885 [Pseudovibrio sp. FO-BEG1]
MSLMLSMQVFEARGISFVMQSAAHSGVIPAIEPGSIAP